MEMLGESRFAGRRERERKMLVMKKGGERKGEGG